MGRPRVVQNPITLSFKLEQATDAKLRKVAEARGVSLASILREAIAHYLNGDEPSLAQARAEALHRAAMGLAQAQDSLEALAEL